MQLVEALETSYMLNRHHDRGIADIRFRNLMTLLYQGLIMLCGGLTQASSAQFAQAEEEERQRQWQRRQVHRNPPPPPAAPQQPLTQPQQQSASLLPGVSADQLPQRGGIRGGSRRGGHGGRGDGGARSRT